MQKEVEIVTKLLEAADIKINGERPWDIQVHNPKLYQRVLAGGSLAFGEAYMDEWWDCEKLDKLFYKLQKANLKERVKPTSLAFHALKSKILNLQSKKKSKVVGEQHYDIGNDLYRAMLDKRMVYTCAYWKNAETLDEAQKNKLDLVCKKIGLQPGMKVLDIGCGWGSFAKFAAQNYGAKVVGVTISKEQVELGNKICEGLPVEIKFQDYRDVEGKFDRVISLGMFEHVGYKNYRTFMKVAHRSLENDGLFLLHTIGNIKSKTHNDPWIDKYIFPRSLLPSIPQIGKAAEGLFVMEDWHNFGTDYAKTLMHWFDNFNSNWDKIKDDKNYTDRFYRMWKYYLLCCSGSFQARKMQLWQIVMSKDGLTEGYTSIR